MTTTYYIPPDHFAGDEVVLPSDEARHAVQVLRHKVEDEIIGVDGAGGWYRIELTNIHKKNVIGRVVERRQNVGEPSFELTVALAMLKNVKRFEVFIEKACELGVTRIIPLQTARTEKTRFRADRMINILIAAMKQSGRSRIVQLEELTRFKDVLRAEAGSVKLICHEKAPAENSLLKAAGAQDQESLLVMLGPEGGFSDEEVEEAVKNEFSLVSLGPRRLRAETAAITACAGIMLSRQG